MARKKKDEPASQEQAIKRPHLSASQIEMFNKCPESWRRRYLEREIIPPKLAMLKGTAVHAGAEVNFRQKVDSHQDLPTTEIIDAAVSKFETTIKHDGYQLGSDESELDVSKTKDAVALMAATHAAEQAPDYQPTEVEKQFRLELPAITHDLVGVIDLVTDKGEVVDFKTAGKKMSQDDANASTQLTVYAAAKNPDGESTVKLDVLIAPTVKMPVRRQVIESSRDKSDLPILAKRVAVVSKTIDAGLFPPAAVGSWWCSEGWCGYWATCPYVNSERIAASRKVAEAMKILEEKE